MLIGKEMGIGRWITQRTDDDRELEDGTRKSSNRLKGVMINNDDNDYDNTNNNINDNKKSMLTTVTGQSICNMSRCLKLNSGSNNYQK